MIVGNLDGVFHGQVTGWALKDNACCAEDLVLFIDGEEVSAPFESYDRPDVEALYGCELLCGFKFKVDFLDKNKIHRIKLKHKSDGFDFNSTEVSFCLAVSSKFSEIKQVFYPEFYRVKYQKTNLTNEEAWEHYFKYGVYKDYDPSPWFSNEYFKETYSEHLVKDIPAIIVYLDAEGKENLQASSVFCPAFYSSEYPDVKPSEGLLAHYTVQGHGEGRKPIGRQLPQHIVEELNDVAKLEPSIAAAAGFLSEIVRYPELPSSSFLPEIVKKKIGQVDVAICIPFISIGGADLLSTYVLKSFQEKYPNSKIALVVTDSSLLQCKDWLSTDTNIIVFDDEVSFKDHSERVSTLHTCLGIMKPKTIINVNSSVCWELYKQYGNQLSTVVDLYAMLFCFDYNSENSRVGYITSYLRECIAYMSGVIFDNNKIIEEVSDLYGFLDKDIEKLHCVYTPVPISNITTASSEERSGFNVLWQGRLSHQKRPDLLVRLAEANPQLNFYVYGPEGSSPYSKIIIENEIPNIIYEGTYSNISEIPLEKISLYLNTSQWDGIPTILLQMLSVGLPIVSTNVGGISEVTGSESCVFIDDIEDVEEYQIAMNKILFDYDRYLGNAIAYSKEINSRLSWENYVSQLEKTGIYDLIEVGIGVGTDATLNREKISANTD